MQGAVIGALTASDRGLITFIVVAVVVLGAGTALRWSAQRASRARTRARAGGRDTDTGDDEPGIRGLRRRGGVLIAVGGVVGLALAPAPDTLTVVAAVGAAAFAGFGALVERAARADRLTIVATLVGAVVAVAAGARLGPTGVEVIDVTLAFVFVTLVTKGVDGLGNVDGLASGLGAAAFAGVFALAAFGIQDDLATVALGLAVACFTFLAFNLRPASLFVGRAGRLAIGYGLAVTALAVDPAPGPGRDVVTPLILAAVVLVDLAVVAVDRLRRRRPLTAHRSDHVVHRLVSLGWSQTEAVALLVALQVLLSAVAVFTGRGVLAVWLGITAAVLVVVLVAAEAARGHLDYEHPEGLPRAVWIGLGVVAIVLVVGVVPTALAADDAADLMLDGRDAASRALAAARDGDTITARGEFNRAARTFGAARDKLGSPLLSGGLAIPGVASNLRAARALAEIGEDLATSGESVTSAVDPTRLEVIDGRLPIEEVVRVTPVLREGSTALTGALDRLDGVRDDPYLAGSIEDAVDKIHAQLTQAEREARHAADAARFAPALFGGDGPRRYLLVVQNNAESRPTGGFIGSFGTITAEDGKLTVSELERTGIWNAALREHDEVTWSAPDDYRSRYAQFLPQTTVQNVNMTPDFPTVAEVLLSLSPQTTVGEVDGVMAVDPEGLAALLSLTGPITVPDWPAEITSDNVVDVTLRDAYNVLGSEAQTDQRVDFLGSVAEEAVDQATTGSLGEPAKIAQALGDAAHEGHITLAFRRPAEQLLAEQLDVADHVRPVRSDAIAVTTSNAAGNKIDYYLQRAVDYQVMLEPNDRADAARATGTLSVALDNTAPAEGLPQIVIGPFDDRFVAGQNRSYVSMYTPLDFVGASLNGAPTAVSPGRELDRNVVSLFDDIPATTVDTLTAELEGAVALHDGWYTLEVRHQPTLNPDRLRVSIEVPEGWRIDAAPGMDLPFERRAKALVTEFDRTRRYRVHVTRDVDRWDLWNRLEAGT